jgi:hypothetical protein
VAGKRTTEITRGGAFALLALIGFMALAGECRALPYRPAGALSIVSQYAAFNDSAPPHTQIWQVVPAVAPDGGATLQFFLEAAARPDTVCEITLPASGAAGEIRWKGIGSAPKSGADILLTPGFPAPCDILPVTQKDDGRVYQEKTGAGGRVFLRTARVSYRALGVDEARAMGWIREAGPGALELIMVTVFDETGRLVVRQLWPANGSWWIYEETPLRRSWLSD